MNSTAGFERQVYMPCHAPHWCGGGPWSSFAPTPLPHTSRPSTSLMGTSPRSGTKAYVCPGMHPSSSRDGSSSSDWFAGSKSRTDCRRVRERNGDMRLVAVAVNPPSSECVGSVLVCKSKDGAVKETRSVCTEPVTCGGGYFQHMAHFRT